MIKAYYTTPLFSWLYNHTLPGRSYVKTTLKSNSYWYYDRIDVTDQIDILTEGSINLIDTLNNIYSTPNTQYQLPIVANNDKITVYLPFFDNAKSFTIHDVILDVTADVIYDQSTVTYQMTNITPIIGDISFDPFTPTTSQNNNPTIWGDDINFDRGSCGIITAPQYIHATITPDCYAQRTRPTGYNLPNNCACAFWPNNSWLTYANATSNYSLFKTTTFDVPYNRSGNLTFIDE